MDAFWEQHKLPCTFVIKKHHVSHSGRGDFITFSENCKTAFFGDVAEETIADNDVEVSIITADTISVKHTENKNDFYVIQNVKKLVRMFNVLVQHNGKDILLINVWSFGMISLRLFIVQTFCGKQSKMLWIIIYGYMALIRYYR
jgi:hypothetical protein